MKADREVWNLNQKALRAALGQPQAHAHALELFLAQHASLHTAAVAGTGAWSLEDEVMQNIGEAVFRRIPHGMEHSIAWVFWHLARIEDVTMNVLLAGAPQVLYEGNWLAQMRVDKPETGNAMSPAEIVQFSETVDMPALRAYRAAVGLRTRQVVVQVAPGGFTQKVQPERLLCLLEQGAVVEATRGLLAYWGGLTLAGLLLMPPTRHNFLHLNEAARLKAKKKA